ncbi:transcriptional regulator [Peptococcaceae bacterium 1198_IL3148]
MINKHNIAIFLGVLLMMAAVSFFSTVGTDSVVKGQFAINNIDNAVGEAIKDQGNGYADGECIAEGHIILDIEDKGEWVKVYTISSVGWFGFENGVFTKISGSGAIPTVITFSINKDGEYSLHEYKVPMDGAGYLESIKKMFPRKLHNSVLNAQDYYADLAKQQEAQATEYLKVIGRTAKVSADHVEKQLANINVEASNKLFAEFTKYDSLLNNCPYWLGTKEMVENGVRYIYETAQRKSEDGYDIITFKKSKEDGTVVEERCYKIVGNEIQLIK